MAEKPKKRSKVYLVGAGPGRADLITVRGAEVLKAADCIIYDKLANPALLEFAPKDAEIIHVPKRIGDSSFTQDEINKLLVEKGSSGRTVVRLKGGDPCIFGRCAEEAAILADAGIDFEIVPGITAGIAVSEYAGIMLTHRDYSSQVVFVTGREKDNKAESNIDWPLLARFRGTIVFYMGMSNLDFIANQLIGNGMNENTPVAVVANVSFPNQKAVKASLCSIHQKCKQQDIGAPAIVVVGAAAESDARLNWFMKKPLFGKKIVVTRDDRGNIDSAHKIIQRGGHPLKFATIEIQPLTKSKEFLDILAKLAEFNWVIFTSINGVTVFFEALQSLQKDGRCFGSAKIAAIGSQTAGKLTEFGIRPDFVPSVFTARELGKQLIAYTNLQDKKILLLRSELASNELVELLEKAGAEVRNVAAYTTVEAVGESKWLADRISKGEIDWLTFASPSSVKGFFKRIGTNIVDSSGVKVASVGPVTSSQLNELGVKVDLTAKVHTIDGLIDAIEESYR